MSQVPPFFCVTRVEDSNRLMKRTFLTLSLALLACAGAQAATVRSTFTLTGTATLSATGFVMTGQATLTNVGSGTFASTISGITSATVTAPFTITLSGGTLTGTYTEPLSILYGGAGNASATITGGTGSFAGYRSEEHTSELQSLRHLVCRLLLEK